MLQRCARPAIKAERISESLIRFWRRFYVRRPGHRVSPFTCVKTVGIYRIGMSMP
jgi:hypothetical protein